MRFREFFSTEVTVFGFLCISADLVGDFDLAGDFELGEDCELAGDCEGSFMSSHAQRTKKCPKSNI
jgi:hypothetical protein